MNAVTKKTDERTKRTCISFVCFVYCNVFFVAYIYDTQKQNDLPDTFVEAHVVG